MPEEGAERRPQLPAGARLRRPHPFEGPQHFRLAAPVDRQVEQFRRVPLQRRRPRLVLVRRQPRPVRVGDCLASRCLDAQMEGPWRPGSCDTGHKPLAGNHLRFVVPGTWKVRTRGALPHEDVAAAIETVRSLMRWTAAIPRGQPGFRACHPASVPTGRTSPSGRNQRTACHERGQDAGRPSPLS